MRDGADDGHQIAVNSARKLLRLAQSIAEQLHASVDLTTELSAVSKAHLFLGYLSPTLGKDEGKGTATMVIVPTETPTIAKIDNLPKEENK